MSPKNRKQVKLELLDCNIVWLIFLMEPRRTDLSPELLEQQRRKINLFQFRLCGRCKKGQVSPERCFKFILTQMAQPQTQSWKAFQQEFWRRLFHSRLLHLIIVRLLLDTLHSTMGFNTLSSDVGPCIQKYNFVSIIISGYSFIGSELKIIFH